MTQPTRSDVHVNRPLTNISIAYIQDANDFIADKVFPNLPVQKQSDRYFSYDKDFWFRTGAEKRAPGSESAGGGFAIDNTPNYFADVFAFHTDVADQIRSNADDPINLDRDTTKFVTQNLLLKREKSFIKKYIAPSIWQGYKPSGSPVDFTPSILWSASNSNPVDDIESLKQHIKSQTGFEPNTLTVSADVFAKLKNNPSILDRIKYTQRGLLTEELLGSLFGIEKFLVARAVLNSSQEGVAASMDFMTKKSFLLCYSAPSPSILQPSAGYVFSWQGLFGAGAQGNRIKTFRMEHLESDRIEGEMAYDMKMVGADLGVYGASVIA